MPDNIEIIEVSPRDGLQNEPGVLETDDKIELVRRAVAAGARRVEVTSFVSPRAVPQMADAEAVVAGVRAEVDVRLAALIVNARGLERAIASAVDEVNYVVVATHEFSRRNQGCSTEEAIARWSELSPAARNSGVFRTVTIAASFGCPFSGEVSVAHVVDLAARLAAIGLDELCLADTIGVADPVHVLALVDRIRREVSDVIPLRCHFHNTRNTGIANAYAAATAGVRALDASLGGIGGCPFAPAATGNIPTEDLAYMFERMGMRTGLDLAGQIEAVNWLGGRMGKRLPGMLSRAGVFPTPE